MPHDKNGVELAVGDEVTVRARVTSIAPGDDYCNVTLETTEKMYPGQYASQMSLNAKQVEKAATTTEPTEG